MSKSVITQGLSRLHSVAQKFHFVAKGLNKETGIPYLQLVLDMILSFLRYRAVPDEYKIYRFYEKTHFAKNCFLTGRRKLRFEKLFNPEEFRPLFNNKNEFNRHFSDFIGRKWLYAPDASDQQIEDFLSTQKTIIVKPRNLLWGLGVYKLVYSEVADVKAFCESARKDCLLLEEAIEQHPDLSSIHPDSVNSLRINTVLDKEGVPHILRASLRMGRGQSVVDNLHAGGIAAQIDLDTGVLYTPAIGSDLQTYVQHPISGVVLPGFQIPHWEAARKMVLHVATMSPQTRWIGWDVAITKNGPLLIEDNTRSAVDLLQFVTQTGFKHILRSYL